MVDLMDTFPRGAGDEVYDGIVKLKLVHAPGRTIFLTDMVFIEHGGWHWLQPHFFGPPLLSFHDQGSYAQFDVDLESSARLLLATTGNRYIRTLADHSHLYRCRISGPPDLISHAAGAARRRPDDGFEVRLFHHTRPDTRQLIESSSVLRGSAWNFQGNTKLKNVAYAYLTRLPEIRTELHLQQIAMSSTGNIYLLLDDHVPPSGIVPVRVYRETTHNRTAAMPFWVAPEALSPSHVIQHAPAGQPVFYEVSNPAIARIGLVPGAEIPIDQDLLLTDKTKLKRFDYVIIGDATDPLRITAPFHEEDTARIFAIETNAEHPLSFWRTHANTEQFVGKKIDLQQFD